MSDSSLTVSGKSLKRAVLPHAQSLQDSALTVSRRLPCLKSLDDTLCKLEQDRLRSTNASAETGVHKYFSARSDLVVTRPSIGKVVLAPIACNRNASITTSPGTSAITGSATLLEKNIKLLKAAAIGDLDGVDAALAQGADVNTTYDPALMSEALGTDADIAESQLRRQRVNDPDYVYTVGDWVALPLDASALILASRAGHVAIVQRLLAELGVDCNMGTKEAFNRYRNGQTAILWACRQGNLDVVRVLLADERVDVTLCTVYGVGVWQLAAQQGHLKVVEELLASPRLDLSFRLTDPERLEEFKAMGFDMVKMFACDCIAAMGLFAVAGENRVEVVRRCLQDVRFQKIFSPEVQAIFPEMMRGLRIPIMLDNSPAMLALFLESGLTSPNDRLPDGSTLLDDVVNRHMVEHVRVLLMHNAESTVLRPVHRAQILGDALQLKELVLCGARMEDLQLGDDLPALHQAALKGDDDESVAKVQEELDALGSPRAARDLLDKGKLPAAFYAVEVGHLNVAREIFKRAHGFHSILVDQLIEACQGCDEASQGERSFRVCLALIDKGALEDNDARAGALAFLKPWCSSLVATRCLEQLEHFRELSQLCQSKNEGFYKGVDEKVTVPMLKKAASIAADMPTEPVRQDDAGVIPRIKFYRVLAVRATSSFDHEAAVAMAYAYLGQALETVFQNDVRQMFSSSPAEVITVAPKSFQRMQNKLLNPEEHGDPNIARPRCAKNVDVLRGCIIVETVQELEEAFGKLQAACQVVRVKNTHDPSADGFRGGYRSLLVNFLYEPGLTWAQLFGDAVTFDARDGIRMFMRQSTPIEENETHLGNLWVDYVEGNTVSPSMNNLFALQGLQVISSEQPHEPVRMIAELQLVLRFYFEGRAVSHLLFKIGRCDTGAMEMVRDFYQEYFHKEARQDERLLAVQDIAMAARDGRPPPKRASPKSVRGDMGDH